MGFSMLSIFGLLPECLDHPACSIDEGLDLHVELRLDSDAAEHCG